MIEKLQAADWDVRDLPDRIQLRRKGNTDDSWATVMKNEDGTLHLVTARSAFHRDLAAILAAPAAPAAEGADYEPRAFGQ